MFAHVGKQLATALAARLERTAMAFSTGTPCQLGRGLGDHGSRTVMTAISKSMMQMKEMPRKAPKTMIDELVTFELSYELAAVFQPRDCDILLVTQRQLHDCPPAGYTSLARPSVDDNAQYKLQVLLHTIE